MDLDNYIKNKLKRPIQKFDKVYVYNGHDKLVSIHNTIDLGKEFFLMTNDMFFEKYGFNFVPSGDWWSICKRESGKM